MKKLLILTLIIVLAVGGWFVFLRGDVQQQSKTNAPVKKELPFDKSQFSIDDSSSIWAIVNKRRPLEPKTYKPATLVVPNVKLQDSKQSEEMQLRPEAAAALEKLVAAAKSEATYDLMLASGYRGFMFQKNLYDRYVAKEGQASADKQSARAGHSEHQTGLAADVAAVGDSECVIEECFAATPEGMWVAKNAHRFGFVIRYSKEKIGVTGYQYEPWHLRYVGDALAGEIYKQNTTLEEFFGLEAASDYGS
jgi:zinc D-Ala-D-Ala carboxypeptidase